MSEAQIIKSTRVESPLGDIDPFVGILNARYTIEEWLIPSADDLYKWRVLLVMTIAGTRLQLLSLGAKDQHDNDVLFERDNAIEAMNIVASGLKDKLPDMKDNLRTIIYLKVKDLL